MTTINHDSLKKVVASIGVFLVAISLYCSFLLYTGFSNDLGDKAAWGGVGLGLDMFKNIALPTAFALWGMGMFAARLVSGVLGIAYILLTVLSFSAFFGFMSGVQHGLEKEALAASSRYAAAQAAVESATREVESLSKYADKSVLETAAVEIAKTEGNLKKIQQAMAAHANPDCSPKKDGRGNPYTSRAAEWCGQLRAAQAVAAPWQEKIEGHQRYKAALAHREQALNELASLGNNGVGVTDSNLHPMFLDLGRLLNTDPRQAKVVFMFVSSASAEILGTLSILIAMLLGKTRSFTLDEIEQMSSQLRGQQERLRHALGLADPPPMATPVLPPQAPPPQAPPAIILPAQADAALLEAVTQAVLRGEIPPQIGAVRRRFKLSARVAETCMEYLQEQGLTPPEPRLTPNGGELCCAGMGWRDHYQRPRQIRFPQPKAALPVLRPHDRKPVVMTWGRREDEDGALPAGGWASLDGLRNGEWSGNRLNAVLIPATRFLQEAADGAQHWIPLPQDQWIQGVVVDSGHEKRLYVVTVDTPPPGLDTRLALPGHWPRLIRARNEVEEAA